MAKKQQRIAKGSALNRNHLFAAIAVCVVIGVIFILRSSAATNAVVSLEAERGMLSNATTVSENATTSNNAFARLVGGGSGGVLSLDDWTYIHADASRQDTQWRWGLGLGDINGDGYADIAAGRYVYINKGTGDITGTWQRIEGLTDAQLVANIDGDQYGDVMDLGGNPKWLEWDPSSNSLVERGSGSGANAHQGSAWGEVLGGGMPEVVYSTEGAVNLITFNGTSLNVTQLASGTADEGVAIADLNGDGKPDVVASDGNNAIWLENNGTPSGWAKHVAGPADHGGDNGGFTDKVAAADIDQDGKPDILLSEEIFSASTANTYWFKNPGGAATGSWQRSVVASQDTTNSMSVADMDGDGDIDVITGEHRGDKEVVVWENGNNGASWTKHQVDTGKENHGGTKVIDLDNDGDLDIVSIAYDAPQDLHIWRNDAK